MKVEPGASNVIPGKVTFPVELRDLDEAKINRIAERILERFKTIGRQENVTISCTKPDFDAAALTAKSFQHVIRASAREAGLDGAGRNAASSTPEKSMDVLTRSTTSGGTRTRPVSVGGRP